jgi:hypothetical protein
MDLRIRRNDAGAAASHNGHPHDGPTRRLDQTGDRSAGRGFSAAWVADKRQDFALSQIERHVLNRMYCAGLATKEWLLQKTVTHGHVASYAHPVAFKAGDQRHLSGKTGVWDGHTWLWPEEWVDLGLCREIGGSCVDAPIKAPYSLEMFLPWSRVKRLADPSVCRRDKLKTQSQYLLLPRAKKISNKRGPTSVSTSSRALGARSNKRVISDVSKSPLPCCISWTDLLQRFRLRLHARRIFATRRAHRTNRRQLLNFRRRGSTSAIKLHRLAPLGVQKRSVSSH